jgi:hypothetical protein
VRRVIFRLNVKNSMEDINILKNSSLPMILKIPLERYEV